MEGEMIRPTIVMQNGKNGRKKAAQALSLKLLIKSLEQSRKVKG
jgi:hypothetical protein